MKFSTKKPLLVYRYFCLLILIGIPLFLALLACDRSLVKQEDIIIHVCVCLSLSIIGGILIHKYLWEKLFATLIISNSAIVWRCPFRKSITLPFDKCNFVGVQKEESYNGLPYSFVYFSNKPYPTEYIGKINKLHCSEGFIKFWYSKNLGCYLVECLPQGKAGAILAYQIQEKRKK